MAGSPQHATLVANVVKTITFEQDYERLEVLNVDGAAVVYFRVGVADPVIPTTDGTGVGSEVLPATICSAEVRIDTAGGTVVKLISAGTPKVSVRGLVAR